MSSINRFKEKLFDIAPQNFDDTALEIFEYQSQNNKVYREYLRELGKDKRRIVKVEEIPFLPIEFFKFHKVQTHNWTEKKVFLSSGTTKTGRSRHYVRDVDFYLKVSRLIFESHFESPDTKRIHALLPSYIEQGDSSLICMVDNLIQSGKYGSGYFNQSEDVFKEMNNEEVILIGVTYALLDLAQKPHEWMHQPIVIETGGMKGRHKEITRRELHHELRQISTRIFTEYGMTELFSQAYGQNGKLKWPAWCKSLARNLNDPFELRSTGSGGLNIIDLANIDTCCFIETKDLASIEISGEFEILGRMDNSDIRGCSLLL